MTQVHLGHVFHIAGNPLVTEAAEALVSIPNGALVIDGGGTLAYCGEHARCQTNTPPHQSTITGADSSCPASSTRISTSLRPTPVTPTPAASCWSG